MINLDFFKSNNINKEKNKKPGGSNDIQNNKLPPPQTTTSAPVSPPSISILAPSQSISNNQKELREQNKPLEIQKQQEPIVNIKQNTVLDPNISQNIPININPIKKNPEQYPQQPAQYPEQEYPEQESVNLFSQQEPSTTLEKYSSTPYDEITEIEKEKIKILLEDNYGCLLYSESEPNKYITKLQLNNKILENELKIAEKIRTIKNSPLYFAPILENNQNINIGQLEETIQECSIAREEPTAEYTTSKIKYVGKYSLKTFLENIKIKYPQKIQSYIAESHIQLLTSIEKLLEIDIVHMDIKENNILYDDYEGRFIIIDFGIAIDTKQITYATMNNTFFDYSSYSPWSIEIYFLSHLPFSSPPVIQSSISQSPLIPYQLQKGGELDKSKPESIEPKKIHIKDKTEEKESNSESIGPEEMPIEEKTQEEKLREEGTELPVPIKEESLKEGYSSDQIKEILYPFFQMPFIQTIPKEKIIEFKEKIETYFITNFEYKTKEEIYTKIIQYAKTWDNYALAIAFIKLINIFYPQDIQLTRNYKEILYEIILSTPDKRSDIKTIKDQIKKLFTTISPEDYKEYLLSI